MTTRKRSVQDTSDSDINDNTASPLHKRLRISLVSDNFVDTVDTHAAGRLAATTAVSADDQTGVREGPAAAAAVAPIPKKAKPHSHLLHLPYELRTQIYSLALQKPTSSLLDLSGYTHDNASDAEPALLRTCRVVRGEALPLFYGGNDWVLKIRRVNALTAGSGGAGGRKAGQDDGGYNIIPNWIHCLSEAKIALIGGGGGSSRHESGGVTSGGVVVVGSRGSFVDVYGKWREGSRAAFRLRKTGWGREGFVVEEVCLGDYLAENGDEGECENDGKDKIVVGDKIGEMRAEDKGKRKRKRKRGDEQIGEDVCGIQLVDLLRARMKWFAKTDPQGRGWVWTRERLCEIACLL